MLNRPARYAVATARGFRPEIGRAKHADELRPLIIRQLIVGRPAEVVRRARAVIPALLATEGQPLAGAIAPAAHL